MRRQAGQAARDVAGNAARWAHHLVQLALALLILSVAGVAALAIRLEQGPLPLDWLARRFTAMVNADDAPTTLHIGGLSLAWSVRNGIDSPLQLDLRGIVVADPHGQSLHLPHARVTLAARALLLGHVALRSAELDGLRLRLVRAADGTMMVDLGSLADATGTASAQQSPPEDDLLLADIMPALSHAPSRADAVGGGFIGLIGGLRSIHIHDTAITIDDRKLGAEWRAPDLDLNLTRRADGGADGTLQLGLAIGDATTGSAHVDLRARLSIEPGDGGAVLAGSLSPLVPAALARLAPGLAVLAAVDAPVTLGGTLDLGAGLALRKATAAVALGAGTLHLGAGTMPVVSAGMSVTAVPGSVDVQLDSLRVAAKPQAAPTTITGTVHATLDSGQVTAGIAVAVDRVAFADLPVLWPEGIGGPGTRPWIIENLTEGTAHNAHVALTLTAPLDFSDAAITAITGGLDASDVTCWWLRPVPPAEHGSAKLVFIDPDTADVIVSGGRQNGTGLTVHDGRVRLTGLAGHDQFMAIDANLQGPFADAVALLHHPRIRILDRRPITINNPSGQVATRLLVNMPLKNDLDLDQVALHATGTLSDGHLGGIAAGRDIDHANLDVDVSNDGLRVKGRADVAVLPSVLDVMMDFRPGGPSEILQRVKLNATADANQLARLGVQTQLALTGAMALEATLTDRRDGAGTVSVQADLQRAGLAVAALNWRKAEGSAGSIDVQLRLDQDRLAAIDRVRVAAPGLSVQATGETPSGRVSVLHLQRLAVGDGTDVSGDITLPARAGLPTRIRLHGPTVDLSGVLDRATTPPAKATAAPAPPGPPFSVEASFDRVLTGKGRLLSKVSAQLDHDGTETRQARLTGHAGEGDFALSLDPALGGRRLAGKAADAGGLLAALDVTADMRGGQLDLNAFYDDTRPGHPLAGTATISQYRLRSAPAFARLLQAMSLYGLLEVAQGPGLGFTRLVAPFSLSDEVLTLSDARTFSPSLGMTVKGTIDLRHQTAALEGTLVPAYFFNTLLGRLPLVGKLFSPEEGGGLFAANYAVSGPLADPSVRVNPLSVLTPGFLRGFFDLFGAADPPDSAPPAAGSAQH